MKKLKVLIAEDKAITALDLSNILQHMGYHVSGIVRTGEEAIIKINEDKPDIIFMDIMLNGYYTGIETAGIIKRKHNIPHIYITALNDDETFLKAYSTNPMAIIVKPFTEYSLKKALAGAENQSTVII